MEAVYRVRVGDDIIDCEGPIFIDKSIKFGCHIMLRDGHRVRHVSIGPNQRINIYPAKECRWHPRDNFPIQR
jgi:hypothetical protein